MKKPRPLVTAVVLAVVVSACTASADREAGRTVPDPTPAADPSEVALVETPMAEAQLVELPAPPAALPEPGRVALIDDDGQLALVGDDGTVDDSWFKFRALPAPDRSAAVLSLPSEVGGNGAERPIVWAELPGGDQLAEQVMSSDQEVTATSLDGTFAGLTTLAGDAGPDAIAGVRTTSTITVISRNDGVVFEQQLAGNFVPEAFSRRMAGGIPAQLFLLEYFPADAPRFYRVRVLSTETGEVSLPLDLRNKQLQVDERMAGLTRSQVVAHDHGLLFTLYRGTIDGTPDGEPYAFVHTLDFADGVWCLEIDPALELDRYPGRLAVGGDRLYVASANGHVGSFPIPSIVDPDLSPSMDWTVELARPGGTAPVIVADEKGAWVGHADGAGRLVRIDAQGGRGDSVGLPGPAPTALTIDVDGGLHAAGREWSTFDLARRPAWMGDVAEIVVG